MLRWSKDNMLIHCSLVNSIQGKSSKEFNFPDDIIVEIEKDKIVLRNYQEFPDSYKPIRIVNIESARNRLLIGNCEFFSLFFISFILEFWWTDLS
jgi:hypothetical protein